MQKASNLYLPVGRYRERIIVSRMPHPFDPSAAATFELWDPITGESQLAWEGQPNLQDIVVETSGDWVVIVRTTGSLPFAAWQLMARNLLTGDVRTIAEADPSISSVPNLPVRLPLGFAPTPSIHSNLVVWPEFVRDESGKAWKRIQMHNLARQTTETLVRVDPLVDDVWQPSVADRTVAWAQRNGVGQKEQLAILDLDTRDKRLLDVGGEIYDCALTEGGNHLAWDDGYRAKYAINLATSERVQYAGDEGWGSYRSGDYLSWTPSTFPGGYAGFYDPVKKEVRFVNRLSEGRISNVGQVIGNWFVWQELDVLKAPDLTGSAFYFLPLAPR